MERSEEMDVDADAESVFPDSDGDGQNDGAGGVSTGSNDAAPPEPKGEITIEAAPQGS